MLIHMMNFDLSPVMDTTHGAGECCLIPNQTSPPIHNEAGICLFFKIECLAVPWYVLASDKFIKLAWTIHDIPIQRLQLKVKHDHFLRVCLLVV